MSLWRGMFIGPVAKLGALLIGEGTLLQVLVTVIVLPLYACSAITVFRKV